MYNRDFNNKSITSQNKANKRPKASFYIVLCTIIFCILGSLLGGLSFFNVHAEDTEIDVVSYPNIFTSDYAKTSSETLNGITYSYNSSTNTFHISGSPTTLDSGRTYLRVTNTIPVLPSTTYSIYMYCNVEVTGVTFYSNQSNNFWYNVNTEFRTFTTRETDTTITVNMAFQNIDEDYTGDYSLFIWQGDWNLSQDLKNSIYYQVGLSKGTLDGYFNGYTDGYNVGSSSFENSLGIFSQASFKYNLYNLPSFRDSDISTFHFENDFYSFLSSDNVLFDGYYNGVYIHYAGLENFYFDASDKSWDSLLTEYTETFTIRAFFGDVGVDFSNLYTFIPFVIRNSILFNRFNTIGQNICFWFNDNTSLYFSSADSYYSLFDLSEYTSKKLIAVDFYTTRSDIEFPSLMTDVNVGISYNLGYSDGFTDGKLSNQDIVYNNGFEAGKASVTGTQPYTFFGLISAVIDAPIQAFSGLFNFTIFDINVLSIFTFLITLVLVLKIISLLK